MKNLLIFALLATSFISQKSISKEAPDLVLLTPQQYESLYEADKKKYIMLLRQMAADLSFQSEVGFFESLKIKAPLWVSLLSSTCEARSSGLQIEVVERASDPYRPSNPSTPSVPVVVVAANSCVRCVYGGFPISNTQKCSAVKTSEQMTQQLGTLRFPSPLKVEDFNCGDDKPVMCSPMFFGTLKGKAVCVAQSASATRSCMNTVGKSEESYRSTDQMMRLNDGAARSMMTRFTNICSSKSLCYAGANKSDIEQTCQVVRERMQSFIEGMRTINGTPVPASPRPAPAVESRISI